MSAIYGRISFDESLVARDLFDVSFKTLDQWGKDGRHVMQTSRAIIGFQHLCLNIERPSDHQPFEQDGLCIVADAVIDNRSDLFRQLDFPLPAGLDVPDSQLILFAYKRWGRECAKHLLGDFSFAIWNQVSGEFFAARDVAGARPFFYSKQAGHLFFSTTVEAIVATPDIEFPIDERRVAFFLTKPLQAHENPFVKNIEFLPPGHYMTARKEGVEIHRYWHPEEVERAEPASLGDYAYQLRVLLEQAVKDRVSSHYTVGSHISGGMDSTGVTVLAHRVLSQLGSKLDMAYTWAPPVNHEFPVDQKGVDERKEMLALAEQEGFNLCFGNANEDDYLRFFKRNLMLENSADLFEELPLMESAHSRGTRIMLSGWGADECVTFGLRGYPSWLLSQHRYKDILDMARATCGGFRRPLAMGEFIFKKAVLPFLPDRVYSTFSPYVSFKKLECLGATEFISRYPDIAGENNLIWRDANDPFSMQCALLKNGHISARMSLWSIWAGPLGLQYRYPFMDKRLLEFSLSLPPDMLWQKNRSRIVYATAMSDALPKRVSKHDVANEKKRKTIRHACWKKLKDNRDSYIKSDCPWIDMKALDEKLKAAPDSVEGFELLAFIPLHSGMRVLELWDLVKTGKSSA